MNPLERFKEPPDTLRCWSFLMLALGVLLAGSPPAGAQSDATSAPWKRVASAAEVGCSGQAVNTIKNVIAAARTPQALDSVMAKYQGEQPCGPGYEAGLNWGHDWLGKFPLYLLAVRGWELRDGLSPEQRSRLEAILRHGVTEESLVLDDVCGLVKGDSCSEDFVSFVMVLAAVKNLYPELALEIGPSQLDALEEKYLALTFATDRGYYGLLPEQAAWDSREEVKLYNHNAENPVYAALLFVHANNARYSYLLSGGPVPTAYFQASMAPLFSWIQSKAVDKLSFADTCHDVGGGWAPCADAVGNVIPGVIPAGRFVRAVVGPGAIRTDQYTFEAFDREWHNIYIDIGRRTMYDLYNPPTFQPRVRRRLPPAARPNDREVLLGEMSRGTENSETLQSP